MPNRQSNKQGQSSSSSSPPPPPTSGQRRKSGLAGPNQARNRNNNRHASFPDEKDRRGSDITIVLCVFRGESSGWRTSPYTYRRVRETDESLWTGIRNQFRTELEQPWRRILLFKKVKQVVPIEFSRNDVPKRQDAKDIPGEHEFIHAYRHPMRLRTKHEWVDWFAEFKQKAGTDKTIGLEFVEGIWASKLAAVAIFATIVIIIFSVLWVVIWHGNLQTVFTVMSFVLSGVAAEIALIALYYQLSLPG